MLLIRLFIYGTKMVIKTGFMTCKFGKTVMLFKQAAIAEYTPANPFTSSGNFLISDG